MATHEPVLLTEVATMLALDAGDTAVDCTGGGGGYALELGRRLGPAGRLVVLDRDPDAIERIRERVAALVCRVDVVQADFRDLARTLEALGVTAVDALVADLGVSSFQLDEAHRGFSFSRPGPIDMRFDPASGSGAEWLVNRAREADLEDVIRRYGEERFARRVAAAIVAARPIRDTITLAEVVRRAVPRGTPHLDRATRTFQALRIATNDEIGALDALLEQGVNALAPEGRMAVVAFHSLEDRRVKQAFREAVKADRVTLLTRKPIRPTEAEVAANPRSRSAVLRGVVRTGSSAEAGDGE